MKPLKIVISGSRFSEERKILKKELENLPGIDLKIYDCNEVPTDTSKNGKQHEINEIIQNYDWYILIASTNHYGKYTFNEWETICESILHKPDEQTITVLRCNQPHLSEEKQLLNMKLAEKQRRELHGEKDIRLEDIDVKIDDSYSFNDFEDLLSKKGIQENFHVCYDFDNNLSDFIVKVREEKKMILSQNLVLRKNSIPLMEMKAEDVFSNKYRTDEGNGFCEEYYIQRDIDQKIIDQKDGLSWIIGGPASGKTRAVYEYLKKECKQADNNFRLIVIKPDNVESLIKNLEAYKEWNAINCKQTTLSTYYFVCDQVEDFMKDFEKLIELFVSIKDFFQAKILVTSLEETFYYIKNELNLLNSFTKGLNLIQIKSLKEDVKTRNELIRRFNLTQRDYENIKEVIGEYIPQLVDYHESVKRYITTYIHSHPNTNYLKDFIQAYSVITLFRRGQIVPLALVLAVLQRANGDKLIQKDIEDLLTFFFDTQILSIVYDRNLAQAVGERNTLPRHIIALDQILAPKVRHITSIDDLRRDNNYQFQLNSLYIYDDETIKVPLSPCYTILVNNEYIWKKYLIPEYSLQIRSIQDMSKATELFTDTFINENPLGTLCRVIVRSPSVFWATRLNAHENFVRTYVYNKIVEFGDKFSAEEEKGLPILFAMITSRSKDMNEFEESFNVLCNLDNEKHPFTEDVVAEVMRYGTEKDRTVKDEIINRIKERGWNFDTYHAKGLYYHSRMIEYFDTFEDIKSYVEEMMIKHPENLNLSGRDGNAQDYIILHATSCCRSSDDFKMLISWMQTLNIQLSYPKLYEWAKLIKSNPNFDSKEDNLSLIREVEKVYECYTDSHQKLLKYYHLINMSNCFQNALIFFQKAEKDENCNRNALLRKCEISTMIDNIRPDELIYVYQYLFHDGELIDKHFPQISRNILLKHLNLEDAIYFASLLFTQETEESTSDINTLISLLSDNKDTNYTYQSVVQITSLPIFKHVDYNEIVINLIFKACRTEVQENEAIRSILKPNYFQYLIKKNNIDPENANQHRYLEQETDQFFHDLQYNDKIVATRLKNSRFNTFENTLEYACEAMTELLRSSRILDSNIISSLCNKFFFIYKKGIGKIALNEYEAACAQLHEFLYNEITLGTGNRETIAIKPIDTFVKNIYFYSAYYLIYPEEALELENGKYIFSHKMKHISTTFINDFFYGNILQGLAGKQKEKELSDFEDWIMENIPNFTINKKVSQVITSFLPDYSIKLPFNKHFHQKEKNVTDNNFKQDTYWNFINEFIDNWEKENKLSKVFDDEYTESSLNFNKAMLQEAIQFKERHITSLPLTETLCKLFKTKRINAYYVLTLLEELFLKNGLPIIPRLWKEALECIKYRTRYYSDEVEVDLEIKDLQAQYPHLILENLTTQLHLLSILRGEDRIQYFNSIRKENQFMTLVDHAELIKNIELYFNAPGDYILEMMKYVDMNRICFGYNNITPTYYHFIRNLIKYYKPYFTELTYEYKNFITEILDEIIEQKKHPKKNGTNFKWLSDQIKKKSDDFKFMIEDITSICPTTVDYIEAFLH